MIDEKTKQAAFKADLPVVTNAVALVSQVVLNVAGNAIADTVGGTPVTPVYLEETAAARLQSVLSPYMGAK